MPPRFNFLFVLLFPLLAAGCGGGDTVRVTGQLLKDGKPYTANLEGKEPETFVVDFEGIINDRKYRFPATIAADGSFRVDGSDGRGIPKGAYRICVLHSGFQGAGGDRLQTRFATEKTPLGVEVKQNTKLTIDLGAGTVTN
jgi:hypothetical protein